MDSRCVLPIMDIYKLNGIPPRYEWTSPLSERVELKGPCLGPGAWLGIEHSARQHPTDWAELCRSGLLLIEMFHDPRLVRRECSS